MDDEIVCPRCKSTNYRNPAMKLMVNVCGHSLCETCVDLLFLKGSGTCPQCNIALRRVNFRFQVFENAFVEKEVNIRKKILRDFNKKEEDFGSLRDYNDYLEEIENIIYNLTNDRDVTETMLKIEMYKKDNKDQIYRNKAKMSRDEYELQEMYEMEKQQDEYRKQQILETETESKRKKLRVKEQLIDELMFSNENAARIVDNFVEAIKGDDENDENGGFGNDDGATGEGGVRQTAADDGGGGGGGSETNKLRPSLLLRGSTSNFLPVPQQDEAPAYVYSPYQVLMLGPHLPTAEQLTELNYVDHVRIESLDEIASGFKSRFACMRALQDAFCGLYYVS